MVWRSGDAACARVGVASAGNAARINEAAAPTATTNLLAELPRRRLRGRTAGTSAAAVDRFCNISYSLLSVAFTIAAHPHAWKGGGPHAPDRAGAGQGR